MSLRGRRNGSRRRSFVVATRRLLLAGPVFLASLLWVRGRGIGDGERAIFVKLNNLPDSLEIPVWVVMQAGSFPSVILTSGAARVSGRRRLSLRLFLAGTAAWIGCKIVKRFVQRGRPEAELAEVRVRGGRQSGLGFPSGHSAVAFALASSFDEFESTLPRLITWTAATCVPLARMYVGAHLPADAVGGASLGLAVGALVNGALGERD